MIFENAGIDCLEIEIGMLVRRKKENGEYEWIIEIQRLVLNNIDRKK